jgi:hypothetical protein
MNDNMAVVATTTRVGLVLGELDEDVIGEIPVRDRRAGDARRASPWNPVS